MAKRYTQKKKDEVVQFIKDYDQKNGRGGKAQACARYGINPITIKKWCEAAGIKTAGKSAKKIARAAATGVKREGKSLAPNPVIKTLIRMREIQEKIDAMMLEYNALKGKI